MLISPLHIKNNDYSKILQNLELEYRAQYIVSIGNVFKDGNRKFTVPSEDLSKLLNAITTSYSEYFIETYQKIQLPSNPLNSIGVAPIDLISILQALKKSGSLQAELIVI